MLDDLVDQTIQTEKHVEHTNQHDGGNKIRRVNNQLRGMLEPLVLDIIHHQRKDNRDREVHDQLEHCQNNRIRQQRLKIEAVEKALKIFKADPFTSPDP